MTIKTKYLGLDVPSPVIVGSCGLTTTLDSLKEMEDNGAGAVILRSVFEEQFIFDIKRRTQILAPTGNYGSSYNYLSGQVGEDDLDNFFNLVQKAKESLSIPIIGSINCYSFENWITYVPRFQEAGCDALEFSLSQLPTETNLSSDDVERFFTNLISTVRRVCSMPISIKVLPFYTDMAKFIQQISWMSVDGITLFGRSVAFDIDIDNLSTTGKRVYSAANDFHNTLLWTAALSKKLRCQLSSSSGVENGQDVVKLLLAGAQSVQVVSALYRNGLPAIKSLNNELEEWMQKHGFEDIESFRGMLATNPSEDMSLAMRTLFMKYYDDI